MVSGVGRETHATAGLETGATICGLAFCPQPPSAPPNAQFSQNVAATHCVRGCRRRFRIAADWAVTQARLFPSFSVCSCTLVGDVFQRRFQFRPVLAVLKHRTEILQRGIVPFESVRVYFPNKPPRQVRMSCVDEIENRVPEHSERWSVINNIVNILQSILPLFRRRSRIPHSFQIQLEPAFFPFENHLVAYGTCKRARPVRPDFIRDVKVAPVTIQVLKMPKIRVAIVQRGDQSKFWFQLEDVMRETAMRTT